MQVQIYGDMLCYGLFLLRCARLCMAAPSLLQNILLIGGRLVCPIRPSNTNSPALDPVTMMYRVIVQQVYNRIFGCAAQNIGLYETLLLGCCDLL